MAGSTEFKNQKIKAMRNFLIALVLGLVTLFAIAPTTQSVASVAVNQPCVVVSTIDQAGVTSAAAIAAPEVAAVPSITLSEYQLKSIKKVQYAGLFVTEAFAQDDVVPDQGATEDSGKGLWELFKANWAELLFGVLAFIKILVRLTPGVKDDAVFGFLDKLISWIVPNIQAKSKNK